MRFRTSPYPELHGRFSFWLLALLIISVPNRLHAIDLDEIRDSGTLRVILPGNLTGHRFLPRKGSPVTYQHEIIKAFAKSEGLRIKEVPFNNFSEMIPALTTGKGDVLVANLTINDERRKKIAFSVPLTHVQEQLIVKADNTDIRQASDLDGKFIMVDPASSFWQTIQDLKKQYPGIQVLKRPQKLKDEDEIDIVASGHIHAVIRDSNIADMYLAYRDDIKVAFELGGQRDIAWGMRKEAQQLKSALDHFLHSEHFADQGSNAHTDDLDGIKERRVLRILLRNNASSYFLYRGELMGFEYEMAQAFAKANNLRLEVIVPDTHQQMLEWLVQGKADMAAGFLEPLESSEQMGIAFSKPYHFASRHLVVHEDSNIRDIKDLYDKTIHVRRSSAYWEILEKINQRHLGRINVVAADEDIETETLIQNVGGQEIDATVADRHLLDIELAADIPVKSAITLQEDIPSSVAVRANNPLLLKSLNGFISKSYKGLVYNVLYKKYFRNRGSIKRIARERREKIKAGRLSPYDDLMQKYAERYGFDWRLLAAQMYQESRFDPGAKSYAGARGLLQVMPETAKSMGFTNLENPETGIHAGVKYLDWLRERFDEDLPFSDRVWFTLASYNAGYGHVIDARRLARQKGWNADEWFDNVEQAMLLLSKKEYARKAKHGYVRGREPVRYVVSIRDRFNAYVELTEKDLAYNRPAPDK